MTDEEATKILQVAADFAEGHRRAKSDMFGHGAVSENECHERCAIAASNTAWYILSAFGYSTEDMRRLRANGQQPLTPTGNN